MVLFFVVKTPSYAATVLINEFLGNQGSEKEWVEFYNPDNIDLSGYWIDDDADFLNDSGSTSKKQISKISTASAALNVSNPTFPFIVLSQSTFNNTCSTGCDYVVLFSPEGTVIDQYQYTSSQIVQEGKTIGRSPDSSSNWVVLETKTQGSPNSPALPTSAYSPTNTPTKTPTPTAAKTITATQTLTPTPTKISTATPTLKKESKAKETTQMLTPEEGLVLAQNIASKTPTSTPEVLTAGFMETNFSKILIIVGGIFLVGASLVFLKWKREV